MGRVGKRNRTGRSLTVAGLAITAGGLSLAGPATAAAPPALPNCPAPAAQVKSLTPAAAIPDNAAAGLTSVITVAGATGRLTDVDVTTFIEHTWTGDLDITLTSPQGTTVLLKGQTDTPLPDPVYQQGENDPGVVWDRNNVFNGTVWDDQAPKEATEIVYTNDVPEATLVPEGALGAFIGQNPNGNWTLKVVDTSVGDVGTLARWQLDLRTQDSLPASTTTTVSGSPAAAIPDNDPAGVTSTTTVSGAAPYLTDVNLTTFLPHADSSDLDVTLKSPKGTVVTITTDNGKDDANLFNGTVWDDAVTGSPFALAPRRAPYVDGNVMPKLNVEGALAAFIGENPNGVWTITARDDAASGTGTLQSWQLDIAATAGCATPPATTPPATTPPPAQPAPSTPRLPGPTTSGGTANFTLSAKQLLINQRIGQAAIRRLATVEARLDGRPAPVFSKSRRGTVTLSAAQLLINQRIYQAGVRRAAALEARVAGTPPPVFGAGTRGRVVLSVGQLKVNQRIAQAAVRRANALLARTPGT